MLRPDGCESRKRRLRQVSEPHGSGTESWRPYTRDKQTWLATFILTFTFIGWSFIGMNLLQTSILINYWSFIGMHLLNKYLYWYELLKFLPIPVKVKVPIKLPWIQILKIGCLRGCFDSGDEPLIWGTFVLKVWALGRLCVYFTSSSHNATNSWNDRNGKFSELGFRHCSVQFWEVLRICLRRLSFFHSPL